MPVPYPNDLRTITRASKARSQPAAFSMSEPRRGPGYVAPTGTDTPVFWDITLLFTREEAARFQLWFTIDLERGVQEFDLPIRTEFGLLTHTCRFLPDSLLQTAEEGELYRYTATIRARAQIVPTSAADAWAGAFVGPIPDQQVFSGLSFSLDLTGYWTGGSGSGYEWSIVSGALPPGLTLNPNTGAISGTWLGDSAISFDNVVFRRGDLYGISRDSNEVDFDCAPAFDALYSNVISLILTEVSNGATVFPDTITGGNATRGTNGPTGATAQKPFGAASADFPNTTTGTTSLQSSPVVNWIGTDAGDTTLFAGQWCMDVWIRPTAVAFRPVQCICGDDFTSGSISWNGYLIFNSSGQLGFTVRSGGSSASFTSLGGVIVDNVWQHVAVTGDGAGNYAVWRGVAGGLSALVASGSGSSYTKQNTGSWLWGEQNRQVGGFERNFIGQMKCMRITWGNRRFTAPFGPPVALELYEPA